MNNAGLPSLTAAAGTEILPRLLTVNISLLFCYRKSFTTLSRLFTHEILLDQAFAHCPRFLTAASHKEFGPYLSSNVAGRPFRPTKDLWLGRQLPYQLPNLL